MKQACYLPLILAVVAPGLLAQGPEDQKSRFLSDAPTKWEEYRELSKGLQGKKTGRTIITTAGTIKSESSWEEQVKQNQTAGLVVRKYSEKEDGRNNWKSEEV